MDQTASFWVRVIVFEGICQIPARFEPRIFRSRDHCSATRSSVAATLQVSGLKIRKSLFHTKRKFLGPSSLDFFRKKNSRQFKLFFQDRGVSFLLPFLPLEPIYSGQILKKTLAIKILSCCLEKKVWIRNNLCGGSRK